MITDNFKVGDHYRLKGEKYYADKLLVATTVDEFGVVFVDGNEKASRTGIKVSMCFGIPPLEYYWNNKQLRRVE